MHLFIVALLFLFLATCLASWWLLCRMLLARLLAYKKPWVRHGFSYLQHRASSIQPRAVAAAAASYSAAIYRTQHGSIGRSEGGAVTHPTCLVPRRAGLLGADWVCNSPSLLHVCVVVGRILISSHPVPVPAPMARRHRLHSPAPPHRELPLRLRCSGRRSQRASAAP
jgi:hypothetical protein